MDNCREMGQQTNLADHQIDQAIFQLIRMANPDWNENNGGCEKALELYDNLDQVVKVRRK